ncbi:hypothetical protein BDV12DRAFT_161745 [Aspergillus spectabilis]
MVFCAQLREYGEEVVYICCWGSVGVAVAVVSPPVFACSLCCGLHFWIRKSRSS